MIPLRTSILSAALAATALVSCGGESASQLDFGPPQEGPLALVDVGPLDFSDDQAHGTGVLTVVDSCLVFETDDGQIIPVVWPTSATRWSPSTQTIEFSPIGQSAVEISIDTTRVTLGGGESTPNASWIQRPDGCPSDEWAFVSSVEIAG